MNLCHFVKRNGINKFEFVQLTNFPIAFLASSLFFCGFGKITKKKGCSLFDSTKVRHELVTLT